MEVNMRIEKRVLNDALRGWGGCAAGEVVAVLAATVKM